MSTATCPYCGKPLRPGARFCGNCGASISGPVSTPPSEAPQPVAGPVCPHCGKPIRPGARFCPSCGRTIAPEAAPTPVPAPPAGVATPPPAPAISKPVPPVARPVLPAERKAKGGKGWIWAVVGLLALVCVVVVGIGGWFIYKTDPLNLFKRTITVTTTGTLTGTVTQTVTGTVTPATATVTGGTPVGSPTNTVAPLAVVTTAAPVVATATSTLPPTVPPTVVVLFQDEFDGNLLEKWQLYGTPKARITKGVDNVLELSSGEDPYLAGVTSKTMITPTAGVEITFVSFIPDALPGGMLVFDYDPGDKFRKPFDDPGVLHVRITRRALTLVGTLTNFFCELDLGGSAKHTIQILSLDGKKFDLTVDSNPILVCHLPDIGIVPLPGRISFSGQGQVASVKVTKR